MRIAPATRDVAPAPPVEAEAARVEAAPAPAAEPPRAEAPPKPAEPPAAPEKPAVEAERGAVEAAVPETEPASAAIESAPEPAPQEPAAPESSAPEPMPEPVPTAEPPVIEALPDPGTIAVAAASPEPPETSEPPESPQEIVEAESSAELPEPRPAEAVEEEPSPAALLDAKPPSEPEAVNWVQAASRTQEMTLEQAASRVAEAPPPSAFEDLAVQTEEGAGRVEEPKEESLPAAETSPTMRRPLFRVGEVPIYEEPDFLTELKRELSKCKRVDRPLTLILIRVGDLGQIIELFGRDFREPVLWHIAEQAMESLREVDLVGMMASKDRIAMTAFASDRYGGGRIVSRMRQAVIRKPFRVGEELPPIIPALDFGMATFPADGNEVASLMRRAEEDLTSEKDAGAGSD
jgi:diguanylate cyclase (GGDEF)-like protein